MRASSHTPILGACARSLECRESGGQPPPELSGKQGETLLDFSVREISIGRMGAFGLLGVRRFLRLWICLTPHCPHFRVFPSQNQEADPIPWVFPVPILPDLKGGWG
jgi:hypothetical protein